MFREARARQYPANPGSQVDPRSEDSPVRRSGCLDYLIAITLFNLDIETINS